MSTADVAEVQKAIRDIALSFDADHYGIVDCQDDEDAYRDGDVAFLLGLLRFAFGRFRTALVTRT